MLKARIATAALGCLALAFAAGPPHAAVVTAATGSSCTGTTINAIPPSPTQVGTNVTVWGAASGCPNAGPLYEFWLLPPGGTWSIVQGYSTTSSYLWATGALAAGTYEFSVWAKDSASTLSYDAYRALLYTLTQCTSIDLSSTPSSASMRGTVVTIAATPRDVCSHPLFRFWILGPASGGVWTMVQDYSASNTYTWSTSSTQTIGTYRFSVWLRDTTSTAAYDAYNANEYFNLTVGCPSVNESSQPPGPAPAGTIVTINASNSDCPNPLYEFWILGPANGGEWTLVQPYSTSPSYTWGTVSNQTPGHYRFSVWVRDASSAASYDAYDAHEFFYLSA